MQKRLFICIMCFLVILLSDTGSYAAFPVQEKTNTSRVVSPGYRHNYKKAFSQRRIPQFFSSLKSTLAHEHEIHKEKKRSGWQGIASFSASVLAIFTLLVAPAACVFFALAAIVFGAMGMNRHKHKNSGFAIAGFAIGIIEFLLALLVIALITALSGLTISVM